MGVDFGLHVVEPLSNNQFRIIEGEHTFFSQRLHFLWDLFRSDLNEKIQALLPKKVSFEWFDKSYSDSKEGPTLNHCWPPEIVLNCIEIVYNTIQEHDNEFPPFYWISKEGPNLERAAGSARVFYNGKSFYVRGGWEYCAARWSKEKRDLDAYKGDIDIDLSNKTEFKCNDHSFKKNKFGKWIEVEGPKITLYISKVSFFEWHKKDLEEMMSVCKCAAKDGYLIHSEKG